VGAGFGLADLPAAEGFDPVVVADVRSEVPDSGLARRATLIEADIGAGVVDVDGAAHRVGVGEYIGRIAQQDVFPEAGRDFVAVEWNVAGG
jgi:hypothetical protein